MAEEARELAQPIALGSEHDVSCPGGGDLRRDLPSLLGGRGGELRAHALARGVPLQLPAGLGIDEPQLTELRQLLLARIANLDRHDVMAAAEHEQRTPPVARAAEV